jgi:arylsulfatase A-like enzyme
MYPHAHGITLNCGARQNGLTDADVTTERILHEQGYNTHQYGKWHLHGEQLYYYPDQYDLPHWTREMRDVLSVVETKDPDTFMRFYTIPLPVTVDHDFRPVAEEARKKWEDVPYGDFIANMGRLNLSPEDHFDARFTDHAVEAIRTTPSDQPFMVTLSLICPHDPNVAPSPYYEMFDPGKLELPPNWQSTFERYEKQWSRRIIADTGETGLREFLRVYYAMVKLIDDQVGRMIDILKATGRFDDTIIVFTSDHGDMVGGHGMAWKSTDAFFDEVMRIPMIFHYPRGFSPSRSAVPACLTNICPTLLEMTGQPIPDQVQNVSLVPYLHGIGATPGSPDYTYSERVAGHPDGLRVVTPGRNAHFAIRSPDWKYVRYKREGDQYLFHLESDPLETTDLFHDPAYSEVVERLSEDMDAWLLRTGYPMA